MISSFFTSQKRNARNLSGLERLRKMGQYSKVKKKHLKKNQLCENQQTIKTSFVFLVNAKKSPVFSNRGICNRRSNITTKHSLHFNSNKKRRQNSLRVI